MAETNADRREPPPVCDPTAFSSAADARLQYLLNKQDAGVPLTAAERDEAFQLVELAEAATLLRLRAGG